MRFTTRLIILAAGLVLASPIVASAWLGPYPVSNNYHNPLDLSAKVSLAPKPWVANPRVFVVTPGGPAPPSMINPPAWPTVDRTEWSRWHDSYAVKMRVNRLDPGWLPRVPLN